MTTVIAQFRVADYDAFRRGWDQAVIDDGELRSYRAWRGQDDPNLVVMTETFDTREVAQAIWTSEGTKNAMVNDGVDLSTVKLEYVDEVAAGAR